MRALPRLDLPPQPRVLVITLRRLGDVLLTTPLVRSIRRGFAPARLDALVFRGCEHMLAGNPDLDHVFTVAERPHAGETLSLLGKLARRYDLAVSTQPGDRPTALAFAAARRRAGVVPRRGETGAWWKHYVHHAAVTTDPTVHRVTQLLALASTLGVESVPYLVCPQRPVAAAVAPSPPYAVLHAAPAYRFRRWTDVGWRALVPALAARGLSVVVTGGPDPAERAYLDHLWHRVDPPVHRLDGRLDWPQLAALLRGARVYVGPDTSMTHLAAASGCPTIGLYGPASPRVMGPWPVGGLDRQWEDAGTVQRRGNAWVVQNPLPCLPCDKLGCERHIDSHSQCLDELSVRQVLLAVDQALAGIGTHKAAAVD